MIQAPGGFGRPLANRSFRAVALSLLASGLGDWAARLALTLLVLARTHSAALSSLVVALSFVPWLGPGQILATRLGHLPRIPVMVGADLVRAAVFALLLVRLPTWSVLVLVVVAAVATPPFEAARSALTVDVVDAADYGSAVALLDTVDQAAVVGGYLLGGAAVLAGGLRAALVADVLSFLVSAALLSRVRPVESARRAARPVGVQLGRALRMMWSDRVIRRAISALVLAAAPAAAVEATAAPYARWVLHADPSVTAVLAAAVPVGILITVPTLPRIGTARRLLRVAALTAVAGGLIGGVAFSAGHLIGAVVGFLGAGVLSASVTPAQIAFQPLIPTADRPGVFSVAQGLLMGTQAVAAALGGVLVTVLDARRADVGWMILVVALAGASLFVPWRSPDAEVAHRDRPQLALDD